MKYYELFHINERYDGIQQVSRHRTQHSYAKDGSKPFGILDIENWRYDKNIQAWVEGVIDEETGEWKIKAK